MIKIETILINEKEYQRTYSDAGYMIECDGVRYSEAIDLLNSNRVYTETSKYIDSTGRATETDYIAALEQLGVYAYA